MCPTARLWVLYTVDTITRLTFVAVPRMFPHASRGPRRPPQYVKQGNIKPSKLHAVSKPVANTSMIDSFFLQKIRQVKRCLALVSRPGNLTLPRPFKYPPQSHSLALISYALLQETL